MLSVVKHTVQLTWSGAANAPTNPTITNPDVYIEGLHFRYMSELSNEKPDYPYRMLLELVDDAAAADLDPHWSITIKNNSGITRSFSTISRRPDRFYNFKEVSSKVINDEWTVLEFDTHTSLKSFHDETEAAQCGNDYRVELTEDEGAVWVNRDFLSLDSEYFREQLRLPTNSEKFQLPEVATADFLDYVFCVHPPTLTLTLARVGRIWELAKRFQNKALISACETFVKDVQPDNSTKRCRQLVEADHFGMSKVFTRVLNSLNPSDFKDLNMAAVSQFSPQNLRQVTVLLLWKSPATEISNAPDFAHFLDIDRARQRGYDCTIVVEGSETLPIYVKKAILAVNSKYFKTLFFGHFKETNSDTVTLKELHLPHFLEYLANVYAPTPPLTVTRASAILRLADRFQNEFLFKRCDDFLQKTIEFSTKEKLDTLYLADEFNLEKLFEATLNRLNCDDLKDVDPEAVIRFHSAMRRQFLDRCLKEQK